MKKYFLSAASAALFLSFPSCSEHPCGIDGDPLAYQPSVVTLNLGGTTRADIQTADEAKVSSIQVFVFNGNSLDAYHAATSEEVTALKVTLQATAGTRDIYTFCNAPDLKACSDKSQLLAAVSLLSDNAADSFVMGGSLIGQTLGAAYSGTVDVDRYVARIKIRKITRNFTADAYKPLDFKITKLYLTSAVTNETYGFGAPDPYTWINASFGADRTLATANAFVYNKPAEAVPVTNGGSHTQDYTFYTYADTCSKDDVADPVKFKQTRLVVECWLDIDGDHTIDTDEYFTYPVALGAVASNKSYEIEELVITRPGNHSDGDDENDEGEDDDISFSDAGITIYVKDWTVVPVGNAGVVTI